MYLGDIIESHQAEIALNTILEKYGVSLIRGTYKIPYEHFVLKHKDYFTHFSLSGFPGNCSALVLSDVQDIFYSLVVYKKIWEEKNPILSCVYDICEKFGYSSLFITLTMDPIKDYLVKAEEFQTILENTNPHTGKLNYFLAKKFRASENGE